MEKESNDENIWKDTIRAQSLFKSLKVKKDKLDLYESLDEKSKELLELCEISIDLNDNSSI